MISIIVTGFNEQNSIARAIKHVAESAQRSGKQYEIIQVSPDEPTLTSGRNIAHELGISTFSQIVDPRKGKSFALNLALDKANGEIVVMTDGDVFVGEESIEKLLEPFADERIGGSTGHPLSTNPRELYMGYLAKLLTDIADKKRRSVFTEQSGSYYNKKRAYFPMSGYLLAFRNSGLRYDPRFIDDTLISLKIFELGLELAYCPDAVVYVNYPTTLGDYFKQRRRNIKGNREIHEELKLNALDERTLHKELQYALYPLQYARNFREFAWSLTLYPIRLITWILALMDRSLSKNDYKVWDRIETTK